MIYDYVVTLQNRSTRYIDNISLILCLVSVVFFANDMVRNGIRLLIGFITLFVLTGVVFNVYQILKHGRKVYYSRGLLLAGVGWFTVPQLFWIGLPLIALGLLEKLAKSDLEIGFANDTIVFNSLIKRRFVWSAFNNIILKDDLLTMDFKDNRLLQRLTIEDEPDADEDEFNAYCQAHLSALV